MIDSEIGQTAVNDARTQADFGTKLTHDGSASVPLPEEARALYRRLHTMPEPARQIAFNIIEILKLDTVNRRPMGDHWIQDPGRLLRIQLERFERAMNDVQ